MGKNYNYIDTGMFKDLGSNQVFESEISVNINEKKLNPILQVIDATPSERKIPGKLNISLLANYCYMPSNDFSLVYSGTVCICLQSICPLEQQCVLWLHWLCCCFTMGRGSHHPVK